MNAARVSQASRARVAAIVIVLIGVAHAGPAFAQQQPPPAAAPQGQPPPSSAPASSPPTGPAQIIQRAGRARAARELEQAANRGGDTPQAPAAAPSAPPAPAGAPPNPHAAGAPANPHGELTGRQPQAPIAGERADPALPTGTIRVFVHAPDGSPAKDAEVSLGIMSSDSSRSTKSARTGQDGVAVWSGLATGDRQAYRVNAPYRGAKYSSSPFRLPPSGGYQVEIRQLQVTRDERLVVLYLGATSIELKDERLHVVQQARLVNLGGATYVFPDEGALVRLPEGFMAVQIQDSMTDQRVVEAEGVGLRVHGSLPPGEATMLWGFDLPLTGTEMHFAIDIPWLVFAYRVIADAPPGMALEVDDMPEPIVHRDGGRSFLITEMQRKLGDPPFKRLKLSLTGIPGPGPGRWIAAALALLAVAAGVLLSRRAVPPQPKAVVDGGFAARRAELLARARELSALHAAGETGPQYHAEQVALLTDELAALLFEESEQARAQAPRAATGTASSG